jgi:transposase
MMRGRVDSQGEVFHTFHIDDVVPAGHPLRSIKQRADGILKSMSHKFGHAYGRTGRPSIPPEQLIKALLLQSLYSIRSEIQLCEQLGYNLLFRWFLDLSPSASVWTPEVFSMNRKRFDDHGFVRDFFQRVVGEAMLEGLVSGDHFSVDGTLIQSFASMKSLRPLNSKDEKVSDGSDDGDPGNPTVNFRDQKRSNATHRSIVDPNARLARKGSGKPAVLSHSGHVLMENRNGICLDVDVDQADGHAERRAAKRMLNRVWRNHKLEPSTLGTDKGYVDGAFLKEIEDRGITPHVPIGDATIRAQDEKGAARRRARRRMRTRGYQISQRVRKRIEEVIGWCKQIGGLARARFIARWKIAQQAESTAAAYNLLRMARLRQVA